MKSKPMSMTIAEAGDYFDEHDIFETVAVKEVLDIRFRLEKKKYIGVDMALYNKIRIKAKKLHTTEDSLIREWIEQKV